MESITTARLVRLCEDNAKLVKQLQCWGLIPKEGTYFCKKCGGTLKLNRDNETIDGLRWCCNNKISVRKQKKKNCNTRISFRAGTFFDKSHLSIFQILGLANLWLKNASLQLISSELEISYRTVVDWSSFCREVVMNAMIHQSEKLGGPGLIVEIDESKFGRRKYHRGHHVEGQWVFGGYERGSGKIFMVPVEDRGADTLIPIIEKWIQKESTIITDFWKAYDCLNSRGYNHLKVNHSLNFKDPETGAHTNAIEASWRAAKSITSSGGRRKTSIPGNLARYMFYKRCSEKKLDRRVEFFKMAGELYNPIQPKEMFEDGEITDDEDILF